MPSVQALKGSDEHVGFHAARTPPAFTRRPLGTRAPLDRGFRPLASSLEDRFGQEDQDDFLFALHPTLPEYEAKIEELQRNVSKGWGQWLVPDLLSYTKLPEGIVVGLQICGPQAADGPRRCVGSVIPDSQGTVKVDRHSTDRSYASFNITFEDALVPSTTSRK